MLDEVVARAIAKKPGDRFASAQEFSFALHALLSRSEGEIGADFRKTIRQDFTGEMSTLLNLEPLSELDSAWRTAVGNEDSDLLRSSLPPGSPDSDATAIVRAPRREAILTEETIAEPRPLKPPVTQRGPSSRALIFGMLGAAVLAAGVAVGAVLLTKQEAPAAKEPRYLLVERPGANPSGASVSAAPSPQPATTPAPAPGASPEPEKAVSPGSSPAPAVAHAKPSATDGASALTSAFAKRQGAIQSCFSQNAEALKGSPQISIRFQVAPSGQVESATLQPASLSGTALGGCLLSVAQSTRFPAQEKTVAFSIPIVAQSIKR
jgi:hypothetical protein